jgi:hypothetical protein
LERYISSAGEIFSELIFFSAHVVRERFFWRTALENDES